MTSTRPGAGPGTPQPQPGGSCGTPVPGAWLHLVCCGAPLLIGLLVIAAGVSALAWAVIPAGIVAVIVAVVLVARRRRSRECCPAHDPAAAAIAPRPGSVAAHDRW
jgi:Flp pilus assembly protein TadB